MNDVTKKYVIILHLKKTWESPTLLWTYKLLMRAGETRNSPNACFRKHLYVQMSVKNTYNFISFVNIKKHLSKVEFLFFPQGRETPRAPHPEPLTPSPSPRAPHPEPLPNPPHGVSRKRSYVFTRCKGTLLPPEQYCREVILYRYKAAGGQECTGILLPPRNKTAPHKSNSK